MIGTMKNPNTLGTHIFQPQVPYGPYVQSAHVELGECVASLRKVYLDTKYWILFRDVRLNRNLNPDVISLLVLLEKMVADKMVICPFSTEVFREVFLQTDLKTLTATVELIDQLSGGVCILELRQRIHTEAFHLIRQLMSSERNLHPLANLVWTRAAYVLGKITPTSTALGAAVELAVQKAFFDHMWSLPLTSILNELSKNAAGWKPSLPDSSKLLNDGKFASFGDYKSFDDLFLIEVRGVLDCYIDEFNDIMRQIYEHDTGQAATVAEIEADNFGIAISNIIYECFRSGRISTEVPSIHVAAKLHAGVRWDRNRKYKANDMSDFRHACAAIPYCDLFIGEKSLCHLISGTNLGLNSLFSCAATANAKKAVEILQKWVQQLS